MIGSSCDMMHGHPLDHAVVAAAGLSASAVAVWSAWSAGELVIVWVEDSADVVEGVCAGRYLISFWMVW